MVCGAQLGMDYREPGGVAASVCLCVARRRRDAELKIEMMLLRGRCDTGRATGVLLSSSPIILRTGVDCLYH